MVENIYLYRRQTYDTVFGKLKIDFEFQTKIIRPALRPETINLFFDTLYLSEAYFKQNFANDKNENIWMMVKPVWIAGAPNFLFNQFCLVRTLHHGNLSILCPVAYPDPFLYRHSFSSIFVNQVPH